MQLQYKFMCMTECILIMLLIFLSFSYGEAEEVRYPAPGYEGAELDKVRSWEKKFAGIKIDHTNVDRVRQFLSETLYTIIKQPEVWGNNYFTIVPYDTYKPHRGWVDWTKKGYGNSSIDAEGTIHGHVAGLPFIKPGTGEEVMYNFELLPLWDDYVQYAPDAYINDFKTASVRSMSLDIEVSRIASRTAVPPIPEYTNNDQGVLQANMQYFSNPPELKGTYILNYLYKDRNKEWDKWTWVPALRRVRRMNTTQRQDHTSGADFCDDDANGWFGRISRNTYQLLGRKELLLARNNKPDEALFSKESFMWQNLKRERIKTFVIKAVSKNPNYLYSKQIFYIDPEFWQIAYCEKYDKKGALWKIGDYSMGRHQSPTNETVAVYCTFFIADVQRKHATLLKGGYDMDKQFELSHFTPMELNRIGR